MSIMQLFQFYAELVTSSECSGTALKAGFGVLSLLNNKG